MGHSNFHERLADLGTVILDRLRPPVVVGEALGGYIHLLGHVSNHRRAIATVAGAPPASSSALLPSGLTSVLAALPKTRLGT